MVKSLFSKNQDGGRIGKCTAVLLPAVHPLSELWGWGPSLLPHLLLHVPQLRVQRQARHSQGLHHAGLRPEEDPTGRPNNSHG
jgi:hypothetical protein